MRRLVQIIIWICLINTVVIGQQNTSKTFEWTDNFFETGEKREIQLYLEFDGLCRVKPGYRFDLNRRTMDTILTFLNENPETRIEIGFHSDQRTQESYSRNITAMKAKCVKEELISQGVDADQVTCKGYGATKPIISKSEIQNMKKLGEKEFAYSKNRRIEILIIKD